MDLAYYLRMKFGTSHTEPTPDQLRRISSDIALLHNQGAIITTDTWFQVVRKHCPSAGQWVYRGADTSDLSTLVTLALQFTKAQSNG